MSKNIMFFSEIRKKDVPIVGGKNASLGEMYTQLTQKGINIPNGFATTADAYKYFLSYNGIDKKIAEIFAKIDLNKLEIMIAGREEEAFSRIIPKAKAATEGKKIVTKLKEFLPPQMFAVALQAKVGGKFVARETISARRKDVLAPLYGGDYTRKRKLFLLPPFLLQCFY
jgi:hypothetical protein